MPAIARLLDALNPPQQQAVAHRGSPLLILAGAGSGKTRTLTHRVAHLLFTGDARPHQILAVTFTNKAAREMAERIAALLGGPAPGLWALTFHAFGARLLRAHGELLGYPPRLIIYDQRDRLTLVKQVMKERKINDQLYPPAAVAWRISELKNRLLGPADYAQEAGEFGIEAITLTVYRAYQERLAKGGAADFDDLLMQPVRLLASHPEVRSQYRDRFAHILIDEYQDTNRAQYQLVRLLEGSHPNLVVVGDDDQSIYGWRGADLNNILSFEADHPGCLTLKLEQNYRSTPEILETANHLIRHNRGRKGKALWTDLPGGHRPRLRRCVDEEEEARFVTGEITQARGAGRPLAAFAILYRTHAQSRVIEAALRAANLPYAVYGGQRFYERKEIKDCLAYLRVLVSPDDDLSFERIINLPPRGLGANLLAYLHQVAVRQSCSLYRAVGYGLDDPTLPGRSRTALARLIELWARLRAVADLPLPTLFDTLLAETGLVAYVAREGTPEAISRVENVQELATSLARQVAADPAIDLPTYLEQISLVTDLDEAADAREVVTLMTLHAAKGLEYPVVFITGLEEGLFPHKMAQGSDEEIEEERRLAYVGITRAKERLYLTLATRRHLQGTVQYNPPSRFLDEIPEALLEIDTPPVALPRVARAPSERTAYAAPRPSQISTPARPTDPFPLGARVTHPRWGDGKVVAREGDGAELKVSVRFPAVGVKRMLASRAPLQAG